MMCDVLQLGYYVVVSYICFIHCHCTAVMTESRIGDIGNLFLKFMQLPSAVCML